MLLQVILEGLGLGALLVLVCAAGIRKGAVGMVHLYPMGQPPAGVQPGLYAGVQRPERPFRQRLFPVSCKGRGQRDENADREDRIWGQTMKYAGMPMGMWVLFAGSFQKQLTAYDLSLVVVVLQTFILYLITVYTIKPKGALPGPSSVTELPFFSFIEKP